METVKILHCADVHLGATAGFLGTGAKSRQIEVLMTFEKIIETAVQNNVEIVLIAGDLFDSNNTDTEIVTRAFEKIASAKEMKFVFAAGNHDPLSENSPFLNNQPPLNLYIIKPYDSFITFSDLGVRVYGKSFENVYMKGSEVFSFTPPDDGFINICVLHGDLNGDSNYNPISTDFIKNSKMDYMALGHIHVRSLPKKIGDTYFAYSGCPEGQGFDESGEKGVYIGEIGKNYCATKFLPISRRLHICEKIDITGIIQSEICEHIINVLYNKYGENFSDNLYKIILCGSVSEEKPLDITEISARLSSAVFFAKVKDKTALSVNIEELAEEISLKGIFVKNMLNKIASATDEEKEILKSALQIGLRAFSGKVEYNED